MRLLVKNLLLLAMLAGVAMLLARGFPRIEQGTDFPEFYAAAHMVREGVGRQLYNAAAQREFQARYTGRVGTYFNHPPFELLVYLPLARWPIERAYLLWSLLNVGLLLVTARILAPYVLPQWDWRLPAAGAWLFAPVLLNLIQGQDSVLLLLLLTLTFAALKRERPLLAGALLACGLFKFHLVLPIAAVALFAKRWRLLAGFAAVGILLALVSAAISGWGWFVAYAQFLVEMSGLPLAGIHPKEMANLRGLIALLLPASAWTPLTAASSLLILGCAIWNSNRAGTDLSFANAVMAATLVSYHLSPHDLSLLLLPMALLWRQSSTASLPEWLRWVQQITLISLFLPPLHVFLLVGHVYGYVGVLTLIMFLASVTGAYLSTRQQPEA